MSTFDIALSGLDRSYASMERAAIDALEGPTEQVATTMIEASHEATANLGVIRSADERLEDLVSMFLR